MSAAHQVTTESVAQVERLAKLGISQEQIALFMGMSKQTLSKYYKDIMAIVRIDNICQVAETAFSMAVSGKHPAMTMFYLKTQARWRETDHADDSMSKEPITKIEIVTVNGETVKQKEGDT